MEAYDVEKPVDNSHGGPKNLFTVSTGHQRKGEDMRKLSIVGIVVLGTVLAGCATQVPQTHPEPLMEVPSSHWEAVPTPQVEPTLTWAEEEQDVINGLLRYFDVWNELANNPVSADLNRIFEVAIGPAATDNLKQLTQWSANKWHVEGQALFIVDKVEKTGDDKGKRYLIHGCYISDGYLSDASGHHVGNKTMVHVPTNYEVTHWDGQYRVIEGFTENGKCLNIS